MFAFVLSQPAHLFPSAEFGLLILCLLAMLCINQRFARAATISLAVAVVVMPMFYVCCCTDWWCTWWPF